MGKEGEEPTFEELACMILIAVPKTSKYLGEKANIRRDARQLGR